MDRCKLHGVLRKHIKHCRFGFNLGRLWRNYEHIERKGSKDPLSFIRRVFNTWPNKGLVVLITIAHAFDNSHDQTPLDRDVRISVLPLCRKNLQSNQIGIFISIVIDALRRNHGSNVLQALFCIFRFCKETTQTRNWNFRNIRHGR